MRGGRENLQYPADMALPEQRGGALCLLQVQEN